MNQQTNPSFNDKLKSLASVMASVLQISERDAIIYLTLTRLGAQPANTIGKHLGINRTTMCSILESLWKRNVLKKHPGKDSLFFSACSMEELNELIRLEQKKCDEKSKILKSITPHVRDISLPNVEKNIPKTTYYQGVEQAQVALLRMLQLVDEGSEILGYVNVTKRQIPEFQDFWPTYYDVRRSKKIFMKQISPDTPDCLEHTKKDWSEYRETRIIPFSEFPFEQDYEISILPAQFVTIYLNPTMPVVTVYDDKRAAEAHRIIFYHHWNLIKKTKNL